MNKNIPENWSRDHWSTFAYIETLAVDNNGVAIPNVTRMRTHKHNAGKFANTIPGDKYPTRLKEGVIENHDDWDCASDLIEHGFLTDVSDKRRVAYSLTPKGRSVINAIREYRCKGGSFETFEVSKYGIFK